MCIFCRPSTSALLTNAYLRAKGRTTGATTPKTTTYRKAPIRAIPTILPSASGSSRKWYRPCTAPGCASSWTSSITIRASQRARSSTSWPRGTTTAKTQREVSPMRRPAVTKSLPNASWCASSSSNRSCTGQRNIILTGFASTSWAYTTWKRCAKSAKPSTQ